MARPIETKTVSVPKRGARSAADEARYGPLVVSVVVRWNCPRCGLRRGMVERRRFKDRISGVQFECHWWENTCGHVDLYADVIHEAAVSGLAQPGPPAV